MGSLCDSFLAVVVAVVVGSQMWFVTIKVRV